MPRKQQRSTKIEGSVFIFVFFAFEDALREVQRAFLQAFSKWKGLECRPKHLGKNIKKTGTYSPPPSQKRLNPAKD